MQDSNNSKRSSRIPYHILAFIACWLGGVFDGMDSTFMSVVMPNALQDLVQSTDPVVKSQYGALITSVFLFGWMLGGIVFGIIGDRYGRVRSMIISIVLYALFTGLAGLSQNITHLAICRFLTGLGVGGELVSITIFLSEVWKERSRTIALGLLITSYQAGVLIAGIITRFVPEWRTVFFIGALPAVLTFFIRGNLHESEKWLESRKNLNNNRPITTSLFDNYKRNLIVGSLAFGGLLIGYWASLSWIPMWIQALPHVETTSKSTATIWQGTAAVIGCIVAGYAANIFGRKLTTIISLTGCFIGSYILFTTNQTFSTSVFHHSAFLGFFIGAAQAIMYIYLPELFPTTTRATGVGFCLNAGRLATAFSVLFVGLIVSYLQGYANSAMFFAYFYLAAVVAIAFGVETKDQGLIA